MLKLLTAYLLLIFFFFFIFDLSAEQNPFPELVGYKSTMNFEVWAPSQKDADAIVEELEDYYHRFLSHLKYGGMLKKKPEVIIFKNYKDYLDKVSQLQYNVTGTGGMAIPRSARKPAKVYSFLSDNLLNEVLPHELTHLLFREFTAGLRTDASIPLWLGEGIAVFEEKGRRYDAVVRAAVENGRFIPVAEIVTCIAYPSDLNKRTLFYAESASIINFLISEYGGAKFFAFSRKLISGGKTIDEALSSTYYPRVRDVSQLGSAWLNFQKNSMTPGNSI